MQRRHLFILDMPGVSTIVTGCRNIEELQETLAFLDSGSREKDYSAVLPDFINYNTGKCVHCNHCLPCPVNINIGETLRLMQLAAPGPSPGEVQAEIIAAYRRLENNASDCIQCGDCTKRCPFGVDVITQMETTAGLFK